MYLCPVNNQYLTNKEMSRAAPTVRISYFRFAATLACDAHEMSSGYQFDIVFLFP